MFRWNQNSKASQSCREINWYFSNNKCMMLNSSDNLVVEYGTKPPNSTDPLPQFYNLFRIFFIN